MHIQVFSKKQQAYGAFNGGEIVENKPIGFPQEGGTLQAYSNLFYWAYAEANTDSTIGLHPHQGFEIMSFVLKGEIRHYDTKLRKWQPLKAGDAQIIRAGNGISHSEFMAKDAAMFQIWLDPNLEQSFQKEASYDDYQHQDFPVHEERNWQVKTYIGEKAPLWLDTEGIQIQEIRFASSQQNRTIAKDRIYSIYVLDGNPSINGTKVSKDDFVVLKDATSLEIESSENAVLFMISSLAQINYKTYREIMQERMRMRK